MTVTKFTTGNWYVLPIHVAAPSKAWVGGHSLPGSVGLNPAGGIDVGLLELLCFFK
jgi:hypothetical protein